MENTQISKRKRGRPRKPKVNKPKRPRGRPRKYNSDKERRNARLKQTKESRSRIRRKKKADNLQLVIDVLKRLEKRNLIDFDNSFDEDNTYTQFKMDAHDVYIKRYLVDAGAKDGGLREIRFWIVKDKTYFGGYIYWDSQNSYYKFDLVLDKYRVQLCNNGPFVYPSDYIKGGSI